MSDWDWRKSSFCEANNCVEVAVADGEALARSTLAPERVLRLAPTDWNNLMERIRVEPDGWPWESE